MAKGHMTKTVFTFYCVCVCVSVSCGRLLRSVAAAGSSRGAEVQAYLDDRRPGEHTLMSACGCDVLYQTFQKVPLVSRQSTQGFPQVCGTIQRFFGHVYGVTNVQKRNQGGGRDSTS